MSRTRTQKVFIAGGLIGLIAVAGTGSFVIRDLRAAFVMFCVLFGGLGLIVLVTLLVGEGVVRCFELFAGGALFPVFINQYTQLLVLSRASESGSRSLESTRTNGKSDWRTNMRRVRHLILPPIHFVEGGNMAPKRIRETPRYFETSGEHTAESDISKGDVEIEFMDGTTEVFHGISHSDFSKWEKYHFEVYCAPSGVKLPRGPDVTGDFCTG